MKPFHNVLGILESMLTSATFWIALSAVGALITLQVIRIDTSHTADLNAYKFLRNEDNRFRSPEMLRYRSDLAKILLTKKNHYEEIDSLLTNQNDVLDFYEDLGVLTKKRIAPPDMVWTMFSYDILRYWNATKGYIYWTRKTTDDPTYFTEFEYLYNEMYRIETKRHPNKNIELPKNDIEEYLVGELSPQDKESYLAQTQKDTLKPKTKR